VDGRIVAFEDLHGQAVQRLGLEGCAQVAHFLEHASERPNVTFVRVWFILEEFGRHLVGGADAGVGEVARVVQDLGDAEVAQLDLAVFEEDVLGLEVAV